MVDIVVVVFSVLVLEPSVVTAARSPENSAMCSLVMVLPLSVMPVSVPLDILEKNAMLCPVPEYARSMVFVHPVIESVPALPLV